LSLEAEKVFVELLDLDDENEEILDEFLRSKGLYVLDGVDIDTGRPIQVRAHSSGKICRTAAGA